MMCCFLQRKITTQSDLFNAVNLELARGIIAAAESTGSPVIMGTAEVLFPYGPLEEVSYYLLPMAKKANVPVVIHLDHGLNKETCLKALELGFSSIMYDCSTDSYDENVRKVKEMAEIAHSYGATIEGELGQNRSCIWHYCHIKRNFIHHRNYEIMVRSMDYIWMG